MGGLLPTPDCLAVAEQMIHSCGIAHFCDSALDLLLNFPWVNEISPDIAGDASEQRM